MKNKFFLLGILAVLFAVSLPLYADPGGTFAVSSVSSSIDRFTADIAIPAVAAESSKQALRIIVALAVACIVAVSILILVAPFVLNQTPRVAYDGPGIYQLGKRTISHVRKSEISQAGSPEKNLDSPTLVYAKAGEFAKRTKSELLKRQVS